jgi:hypothetical protein
MTYSVAVESFQEQTLSRQVNYQARQVCWDDYYGEYGRWEHCDCCDTLCCQTEYYQDRVATGTTSMSASASMLLLPTAVSVLSQPSSSYTAASTTSISVTLQLTPAVQITNGHPFSAQMTAVHESGSAVSCILHSPTLIISSGVSISNNEGGSSTDPLLFHVKT